MKLGKALATGVAEEQPQVREEEREPSGEIRDIADIEASAHEEVPAAR